MLKTFTLTAILAASSAFIGYNLDTVASKAMEIRAYMQGAPVDLKAAFWTCYDANGGNAPACEPEAQAWAAADGVDAVNQIALGMTDRMLARHP